MSPYVSVDKEEDTQLIEETDSSKSDTSSVNANQIPKNVSFPKYKPNDITIFIQKENDCYPTLHSNIALSQPKTNSRARILFVLTIIFILLLICLVIFSAVNQLSDHHHVLDGDEGKSVLHGDNNTTTSSHSVFNMSSSASIVTSHDAVMQ